MLRRGKTCGGTVRTGGCGGVRDQWSDPPVGVLPARPAEWAHLVSGGQEAQADLAKRLVALDPSVLASPDRPSVV